MSTRNIRPTFGTKRPRVRIPTLRPNPAEIFRFQPDFSLFSEHFPMENFVTFPFDPNVTQTGIRSGKRRKLENAACRSNSGRPHSCFSLSSSDACHEAADFLRGFFFHACCHMGVLLNSHSVISLLPDIISFVTVRGRRGPLRSECDSRCLFSAKCRQYRGRQACDRGADS